MAESTVVCPKCGHRFPVTKALAQEIEGPIRQRYEVAAQERDKALKAKYEARLAAERKELEKRIAAEAEKRAEAGFARRLEAEKARLKNEAATEARAMVSGEIAALKKQANASKTAMREMQKRMTEVSEREREVRRREQSIQKAIAEAAENARKRAFEEATSKTKAEYRTRELIHQKKIADLEKQVSQLVQKMEQLPSQEKGMVVETELLQNLRKFFPDDEIEPIAKGRTGADILQKVISPAGKPSGTIIWEIKNARDWSKSWLSKLRSDQRRVKADIAVLVTRVLPPDPSISHLGQVSGLWIADFSAAIGLAAALRAGLLEIYRIRMSAQGGSEKMVALYQYLMSPAFKQRVEAVVEAFTTMKDDLAKEKLSTERNWAKRDKQLDLVLQNVSGMVGDIQAITPAFPKIRRLELPAPH
jgi:hypothetical protein